ncbi:SWIB/MDM2 domain-containing protein [Bacteriovorax sp. PP10]|uniref:SWIB/MDM2 domain-containing protein n=1 Tax=Bacteriovorax antarcticus TaxID=3088717 RepID=A0ABU5VTY7_9BACT|nr:SWIB/MDM2 domain-containing protein [Bacteriovorax sp. PP10]MEA9356512.1 SWIB/MDM2 domain-containing protein [Bacteriovorax sp. PP10]
MAVKKKAKVATKKAAPKATKKAPAAKKAAPKATKKAAPKATKKAAPKATKKAAAPKAAKATKKVAAPKAAKATKKVAAPKVKTARKPNAAFMKALTPSAILAEIVGAKPLPRTQVVSKIWDYIKKHNLQNPKNKRNIIADDKLAKLFGKKEVTMFELAGIVGKHLS